MTGNHWRGDPSKRTQRESADQNSALVQQELCIRRHPPSLLSLFPHTVDIIGGWNEGTS